MFSNWEIFPNKLVCSLSSNLGHWEKSKWAEFARNSSLLLLTYYTVFVVQSLLVTFPIVVLAVVWWGGCFVIIFILLICSIYQLWIFPTSIKSLPFLQQFCIPSDLGYVWTSFFSFWPQNQPPTFPFSSVAFVAT